MLPGLGQAPGHRWYQGNEIKQGSDNGNRVLYFFLVPSLLHSDVPFFPFLHQLSAVVPFSSDPVPLLSSTSLLSVQLFPSYFSCPFLSLSSYLPFLFLLGGRAP